MLLPWAELVLSHSLCALLLSRYFSRFRKCRCQPDYGSNGLPDVMLHPLKKMQAHAVLVVLWLGLHSSVAVLDNEMRATCIMSIPFCILCGRSMEWVLGIIYLSRYQLPSTRWKRSQITATKCLHQPQMGTTEHQATVMWTARSTPCYFRASCLSSRDAT